MNSGSSAAKEELLGCSPALEEQYRIVNLYLRIITNKELRKKGHIAVEEYIVCT